MAYLAVAAGGQSNDVTSTTAWKVLGAAYADARSSEAHGGAQVASVQAWFSASDGTATVGFALVGKATGTVYAYRECVLAAGTRRASADGTSGNFIAYPASFNSATVASSYSSDVVNKIDLMHGGPDDFNTFEDLEWRFGVVTDPDTGTVYLSVTTSTVV